MPMSSSYLVPDAARLTASSTLNTASACGTQVLKHLHHVWPHYVTAADGTRTLYLLVHGWSAGKFAVLKHEPGGLP